VQAAIIHVLFNVIGVLIWFAFIGQLAELVRLISPSVPELVGQAKLAAETPRQIANAHTLFNVANMLLFIWFTRPLAWLAQHLVPERETVPGRIKPKYLDELLLETPDLALDRVRLELGRLGECVLKMVRRSLPTVTQGSRWELTTLSELDDDVDALQGAIVTYLGRLSQENILHEQSQKLYNYMAAANYLENIGDTIETNMVDIGLQRLGHQANISRETRQVLKTLHERVLWSVERCLVSLVDNDKAIAEEVIAAKPEINLLADTADAHLSQRLTVKEADRLALFRLETDSIEYLKRIYYFAKRIAKVVAEVDPQPQHQDADAVEA
jgi:phosphate:Na+ symporter